MVPTPKTKRITQGDLIIETFPIGSFACNCSLIYSASTKEALIVDPGNDFITLKKMIDDRDLKVTKLLHTHAHFDHIGQSSEVAEYTKAKLYLHEDDMFLYKALDQQAMFFGQSVGKILPIDEYLDDDQRFGLSSTKEDLLKTYHTPGHSPGSCCFYTEFTETPLLFAGDTLFQRSIGRTDLPGGDQGEIIKSIKQRLFHLPTETMVITGHGPTTSIYEEKSSNPFVC